MGAQFSDTAKSFLTITKTESSWNDKLRRSKNFLKLNEQYFPQFLDEMKGYAKGAGLPFEDMYVLSLEDEVDEEFTDKCTSMITNSGKLFTHNEDWDAESKNRISVIEKTIGDLSILELYYANTLGGNSVSINSNGIIIGLNSLVSIDTQMGLSKNLICRWMQETSDPDKSIETLKSLPRAMGYNYNIVNKNGKIWNVEYSSNNLNTSIPNSPFAHSNHYLSDLKNNEGNTNANGTFDRYNSAMAGLKPQMPLNEVTILMGDKTYGDKKSIMNERTIAKIIIDIKNKLAKIWLLREDELGFVDYDLSKYFT